MFRKRQSLNLQESKVITEVEEIINESGEFVCQSVEQNKSLPDSEMFELGNIVASGKSPEEVDSRVLSPTSVDADNVVRKYIKKSTDSGNTKE